MILKYLKLLLLEIKREFLENIINIFLFSVYHKAKYNLTLSNPCKNNPCSHLCLIVPGGHRCSCPDNTNIRVSSAEVLCDSGTLSSTTQTVKQFFNKESLCPKFKEVLKRKNLIFFSC